MLKFRKSRGKVNERIKTENNRSVPFDINTSLTGVACFHIVTDSPWIDDSSTPI